MDIFNKIKNNRSLLGKYAVQSDGYFAFPKLEGEIAPYMIFRNKKVLVWSINNYLGLANHPEVRKTDAESAKKWGLAYQMGSRIMSGQTVLHEKIEKELADFVGKEDAYLLNFGYQGMVSIIDSLVNRHDVIVYDSESHACIIDGARLHSGKRFVYPHNDIDNLRQELIRAKAWTDRSGGGILLITEGVFGMAGDLGRLDEIVKLKKEFGFRILVDDAHGFGTMGKTGAGVPEHFNVSDEIDLHFATFAKSMAGIGGFVASRKDIIFFLRYFMRSQTFAKSLPLTMVEGGLKRLELLKTRPELKEKLWIIANALQNGLKDEGFDIGVTKSAVTPVYLHGNVNEASHLIKDLRENFGIFCSIVVYPFIPKGLLMLRLIPTAVHQLEDVEKTVNAFKEIKNKLAKGKYNKDIFAVL